MSGRRRGRDRGFTLIELMISLTIMTVALLGMLSLYRTSVVSNQFARRFSEAHNLAVGRLEELRPLPIDVITAQADATTDIDESGVTFHVVHRVERDVGGNPNLYRIRAFASFGDDGDEAQPTTARLEVVRTLQEAL